MIWEILWCVILLANLRKCTNPAERRVISDKVPRANGGSNTDSLLKEVGNASGADIAGRPDEAWPQSTQTGEAADIAGRPVQVKRASVYRRPTRAQRPSPVFESERRVCRTTKQRTLEKIVKWLLLFLFGFFLTRLSVQLYLHKKILWTLPNVYLNML